MHSKAIACLNSASKQNAIAGIVLAFAGRFRCAPAAAPAFKKFRAASATLQPR
ncbi:MAG: hypothetical protein F6K04_01425 [Leptolyngbya sp. SIO4C5]|nr:hypothetical protein [Leptolyngbya sp. SIO4C5]